MFCERTENRKYTRIRSKISLRYHRVIDKRVLSDFQKSFTKNISASGLLFESREMIPLGTKIKIFFVLPGLKKEIAALGKVVRIESLKLNTKYNIGISFQELEAKDRE